MIVLKASITIHAEQRAGFLGALEPLISASRAEAGCLTYECYEVVGEANHFIFFEEWESMDALHIHEASDHLKTFRGHLRDMLRERVPTRVYHVDVVTTL